MNKKIEKSIDKCVKRGLSDVAIRELLIYAYESERIAGNIKLRRI